MEQNKLWHVVLISFKPDTPETVKQEICNRYQTLDKDCGGEEAGIIFWKVNWNLDLRKNVDLVEIAVFENNDAFKAFQAHPKHKEMADIIKGVADWQIGDLYLPFND
ncbi:MAG: Dabb family protein [bacterium]|nr:Dabb family protein [bacterium]